MAYEMLSWRGLSARDYDGQNIPGQGQGEALTQWEIHNIGTTRVPISAVATASGSTTFTSTTATLTGWSQTLTSRHVGKYCMTEEENSGKYDGYIGLITAVDNTAKKVTVKFWRSMSGMEKDGAGTPTDGKTFWILAAEGVNFCYVRPDNANNTKTIYWGDANVVVADGTTVLDVGMAILATDDVLPIPVQNLAYVWVVSTAGGTGSLDCIAG